MVGQNKTLGTIGTFVHLGFRKLKVGYKWSFAWAMCIVAQLGFFLVLTCKFLDFVNSEQRGEVSLATVTL